MKQPSGGEALAQTVEQALGSRLVEVRRSGPPILITSNAYAPDLSDQLQQALDDLAHRHHDGGQR